MTQSLQWLTEDSQIFPPLTQALSEPNGLLAVGGDLSIERLVKAYQLGIFPWYNQGEPILWWSPCPRAIIYTKQVRINRSTKKALRQLDYQVHINRNFHRVLAYCANAPFRQEDTWINPDMQRAYIAMHNLGYAHSIEVYQGDELIGGLYGIAINGLFSGESMFYKKDNASKFALIALAQHLASINIAFIDCQIMNPFLANMGATEISRDEFNRLKAQTLSQKIPNNFWLPQPIRLNTDYN